MSRSPSDRPSAFPPIGVAMLYLVHVSPRSADRIIWPLDDVYVPTAMYTTLESTGSAAILSTPMYFMSGLVNQSMIGIHPYLVSSHRYAPAMSVRA